MDIHTWLAQKGDYNTGLQLYLNSKNPKTALIRHFKKGETAKTFSKLKYELKKIANTTFVNNQIVNVNKKVAVPQRIAHVGNTMPKTLPKPPANTNTNPYTALQLHEIPPPLRETYINQKQLFAQVCFLHTDLCNTSAQQKIEGLELCLQIENLWDQIALHWLYLDYYRDHNIVLKHKKEDFSNLTPAAILQKRNNARCNITKHKKGLQALENNPPLLLNQSDKKKYEAKIRHKQEVLLRNQNTEQQLNKLIEG